VVRPLRETFDEDAERYERARPGYPAELLDDLAALTGLRAGDRVLEIGPGTGQATVPLARRGYGSWPSSSARTSPPSAGATWPRSRMSRW
jgi:SAM-dependent methyltransferase